MKKIISIMMIIIMAFALFGIVSAGGSATNQTVSLIAGEAGEVAQVGINSANTISATFQVNAVQFSGLPYNVFGGNGITMRAYDTMTRVSRNFMTCTTKSGSYTTKYGYAKIGVENNSSLGVTVTYSYSIVG